YLSSSRHCLLHSQHILSLVTPYFFTCSLAPPALHSFPTRRSSDLAGGCRARGRPQAIEDHNGENATQDARRQRAHGRPEGEDGLDRKSTRLNSSHEWISYAVFCLKKKKKRERR